MKEQLRTEAEKREIGWYFVIFSGNERPAYFNGKNWIVWGNMGFWNDSDLSKISDRLIPYFHTQQLEKDNWVSVEIKMPENRKPVIIRWVYEGKERITSGSYNEDGKYWQHGNATQMKVTHWQPLPKSPITTQTL